MYTIFSNESWQVEATSVEPNNVEGSVFYHGDEYHFDVIRKHDDSWVMYHEFQELSQHDTVIRMILDGLNGHSYSNGITLANTENLHGAFGKTIETCKVPINGKWRLWRDGLGLKSIDPVDTYRDPEYKGEASVDLNNEHVQKGIRWMSGEFDEVWGEQRLVARTIGGRRFVLKPVNSANELIASLELFAHYRIDYKPSEVGDWLYKNTDNDYSADDHISEALADYLAENVTEQDGYIAFENLPDGITQVQRMIATDPEVVEYEPPEGVPKIIRAARRWLQHVRVTPQWGEVDGAAFVTTVRDIDFWYGGRDIMYAQFDTQLEALPIDQYDEDKLTEFAFKLARIMRLPIDIEPKLESVEDDNWYDLENGEFVIGMCYDAEMHHQTHNLWKVVGTVTPVAMPASHRPEYTTEVLTPEPTIKFKRHNILEVKDEYFEGG